MADFAQKSQCHQGLPPVERFWLPGLLVQGKVPDMAVLAVALPYRVRRDWLQDHLSN